MDEGIPVEVIRQTNRGFAQANNHAAALAVGCEWIALVNPDAFLDDTWFARMLYAARQHPEYACFASRLNIAGASGQVDGLGDAYHVSGLFWREGHQRPAERCDLSLREVFSPCAAAALYRRDAFLSVGGFDEDFFCYAEDVDLGFRLRLAGHRCLLVPDAVAMHVGSATTGGQRSDFAVYHGHRNLVWAYIKNIPGVLFWLFLPLHLALNLVTVVWFVARGQGRVILAAKRDAVRGVPKVWRKRREVQSLRKASIREIWRVLDKRLWPFTG